MATEPTQVWSSSEAAERWRRTAAQRQQAVGAATELMLAAAGLQPGFRVLDLAAGTGDTSIPAALRVGPEGSVLAVDISATMLQEAEAAAKREGLANVETLVSDIVELDLPHHTFDAAISRFGLMFLTDVVEGLRRVKVALKPGAKLAALVWAAETRNPFISLPLQVTAEFGKLPPDGSPMRRALSLGEPGVFENTLKQAGFITISVRPAAVTRDFGSLDAAVESMQESSAMVRELLGALDASEQERALSALRQRLSAFVNNDGRCVVPGEALLGVASVA
jgi:ubiquinone/menaquinone biosynthesis C-methylase UbiE